MVFWKTILAAVAALTCGLVLSCKSRTYGESPSEIDSLLDPHKLPKVGPWFEGWYVRITPVSGTDRSLGAIVGSFLPQGEERVSSEQKGLGGYAAILDGGQLSTSLRAHESFPFNTRMYLNKSEIVNRDPLPSGPAAFRWTSDGIGELSESSVALKVANGAELKARWGEPLPWNRSGLGPEGIVSLFRSFPLHWFVHSLGSKVDFEALLPEKDSPEKLQKVKGTGYVHVEKNWGISFPQSYVWMQAHLPEQNKMIALAGGRPLNVAGLQPEAWLVGYRSELYKQDFAAQNLGTVFESRVDGCGGRFELKASFYNRRLIVTAQAQRKTFGGLAIPKDKGFIRDGSEQSFQTQIVAQLFEVAPFRSGNQSERLLEQTIFTAGALEFGGNYKCDRPQ